MIDVGQADVFIYEEDEIEKKLAFASVLIEEILEDQREIDSLQKIAKYEKEFEITKYTISRQKRNLSLLIFRIISAKMPMLLTPTGI